VREDATDPPVRRVLRLLLVRPSILDVGDLRRCSELAPADTTIAVVHENLMDRPTPDVPALGVPVPLDGVPLAHTLRVNSHAPPATPPPVVAPDQRGEAVPGLRVQHPRRQRHRPSLPGGDQALTPTAGGGVPRDRWVRPASTPGTSTTRRTRTPPVP